MNPQLQDELKLTRKEKGEINKYLEKARVIIKFFLYFLFGIIIGLFVLLIWSWLR